MTFTAGEIENPRRNLPLSLVIGTGSVLLLYVLCNLAYLSVLPMAGSAGATTLAGRGIQFAAQDRVATAVMESAFGSIGAKLMAGAILISTFGCVNGMLLAGARVYYAMSRDGLFFKSVGKLSARSGVPVNSLWVQCAWTCLLCLSGSYGQLLDYVIFAALAFYILTIAGLFVLRRTRPDAAAPVPRDRLSGAACDLYRAGGVDLCCTLAIQTPVHVARPDPGADRRAGVPGMEAAGHSSQRTGTES